MTSAVTTTPTWTVRSVVQWTTDDLKKRGVPTARLDAELIVSYALKIDRVRLIVAGDRELEPAELEAIRALVVRRRSFEPIAYLVGKREFFGRDFKVDRRVLVPRPDTEILVQVALDRLRGRELGGRIVDLCTGSGCVATTLKCELLTLTVDAIDLSPDALAVARDNAARLGAVWNVRFAVGDLFGPLGAPSPRYDLIVSNPPYIPSDELATLQADVRDHEPRLALDGGRDGLDLVRRIVDGAPRWLRAGGALALEIGHGEADSTRALMTTRGFSDVSIARDYAGIDRVVSGVFVGSPRR
ncbi:MAG: peptide chain release factor N(5)-glutamine methyltransferase [Polyangiales bacterium]